MNPLVNRAILLILSVILIGLSIDPALANRFETIGSGVSGSMEIKIEYLKLSAFVISGLLFFSGLLAMTTNKKNAHELNYTAWKPSSIIFFVLGFTALIVALIL